MSIFLELLFKSIGYSLILYALWLLAGSHFFETYVKSGIRKYNSNKRIKRLRELEKQEKNKKNNPLSDHLENLLASVSATRQISVSNFIMLSFIIFSVTSALLIMAIHDVFFGVVIGVITGMMPYLFALYRLESMRLKTSLAFLNEFHIILQNYQSTNKNVYYTLLNTVQEIDDKYMKRQLRKLISSFQKERNDINFKKNVHLFVFSINSTFAKRFGNLLIKAHLENVDIGNSLLSLSEDITNRKKDMEDESTEKLQTVMLGFSPLFVLPLIVYFSYQLTGVIDFWYYFKQPLSLTMFVISIILSAGSVLLAFLIRKPKADI